MLQDGIQLLAGTVATDFQVQYGTTLPATGNNIGELFYKTNSTGALLYIYSGSAWIETASGGASAAAVTEGSGITIVNDIVSVTVDSGTSLPFLGNVGNLYFKTDDTSGNKLYFYDGSAWVASAVIPTLNSLLPSQTSNSGKALVTNGTNASWTDVTVSFDSLNVKAAVRAASVGNLNLSGTQSFDGVTPTAGDRVLVKNQTTAAQNGIYVVAAGAWTRATDFDNSPSGEVLGGAFCFVQQGTVNADTGWVLTNNGTITIGTTGLTFAQFTGSSSPADAGTLTGTTLAATITGSSLTSVGTITTGTWSGSFGAVSGANLTSLTAANLSGTTLPVNIVSSSLTSVGTITSGTWSGSFGAVSGANLTSLNASNLSSGTVGTARLGTGVANTTTFLRGDNTWATPVSSAAAAGTLTGTTLAANVVSSSLTSVGTIASGTWSGSFGAVSGANLTSLTAANLSGTTLPTTLVNASLSTITPTGNSNALFIVGSESSTVMNGATAALAIKNTSGTANAVNPLGFMNPGGFYTAAVYATSPDSTNSGGSIFLSTKNTAGTGWNAGFGVSKTGEYLVNNSAGTSGQVLTSNGAGTTPTWQASAGGTAAAGTLTGTTLAANVVSSSLTSVGTLSSLAVTGAITSGGVTVGYLNVPRTTTFNSTALGKRVAVTAGITIPATTYSDSVAVAVGDTISVYNDSAAAVSLTVGTGLTAYIDGNSASIAAGGTITLSARGSCSIWYNTTTQVVISGSVV